MTPSPTSTTSSLSSLFFPSRFIPANSPPLLVHPKQQQQWRRFHPQSFQKPGNSRCLRLFSTARAHQRIPSPPLQLCPSTHVTSRIHCHDLARQTDCNQALGVSVYLRHTTPLLSIFQLFFLATACPDHSLAGQPFHHNDNARGRAARADVPSTIIQHEPSWKRPNQSRQPYPTFL